MIEYSTCTQDDFGDDTITPYREGFIDYMFGHFLHQNPYHAYGDVELDDPRYYEWYDGWHMARTMCPNIEPKEKP